MTHTQTSTTSSADGRANVYRPLHTVEEILAWLPTFQTEVERDFNTDDDTRRPCYYTLDYQETTYGWDKDHAEDYGVYNAYTAEIESLERTAQEIINTDPDTARALAQNNEAGFMLLNGDTILADREDFIDWLEEGDNRTTYTVLGARSSRSSVDSVIHLTRKAAHADITRARANFYNNVHTYAHHTHWSPDLEKLLELIYTIDLDKSTLVFKEGL